MLVAKRPLGGSVCSFSLCLLLILLIVVLTAPSAGASSAPAPTDLGGQAVATGVQVTWTAPDTSGDDVVGDLVSYEIRRRYGDTVDWTLVGVADSDDTEFIDTTGHTDGVFSAGQAFQYRVVAEYKDDDDVEYQSATSVGDWVTIWVHQPPQPRNLSAELTEEGHARLSWDAPETPTGDNQPTLTGYRIVISRWSQTTMFLDSDTTEYTDVDYSASAIYRIRSVWGIFESRNSTFSEVEEAQVYQAPRSPEADAVANGLSVSWEAPVITDASTQPSPTGYEVERKVGDGEFETVAEDIDSDTLSYLDTDPEGSDWFVSGEAYRYRVKAVYQTSGGEERTGVASGTASVIVPIFPQPRNLSVTIATGASAKFSHSLSWSPPDLSWLADFPTLSGYELDIVIDETESSASIAAEDNSYAHNADTEKSVRYSLAAIYGIYSTSAVTHDHEPEEE